MLVRYDNGGDRRDPSSASGVNAPRLADVDRMDSPHAVAELVEILGARIAAAAGGVGATRLVREWIVGERKPARSTSLATALKAARVIADRYGAVVAQRWFVGTNDLLDHRSPVEVLRENTPEGRTLVMRAAVAFVE